MYQKVSSNVVLKSEIASVLQSTAVTHHALARFIPVRDREIYSQGFYDALQAVAMAYDFQIATPSQQAIVEN